MRRFLAALALAVVGLALASPPPAGAHALLANSDPAAGALLQRAPSAVVLTFTEAPDLSLSSVHVVDATGRNVERAKPALVAGQRTTVAVGVPTLDRGIYTVAWRATSADDGHTTTGSFAFGVGVQPTAASASTAVSDPVPSTLSVVGRWTLYLGLAALLGAAAMVWFVSPAPTRHRRALFVAWLAAAAGALLLTIDASRTTGAGISRLLSTATGGKLLIELLAVAATGAVALVASQRRSRRWYGAIGVGAALAMLARARSGHAAVSSVPLFTIGTQWVHLIAVGVWIGGLPWLVAALRNAEGAERAGIARRFSSLAALALAVVLATGTARSIDDVGSWHGLLHTRFGVTLLIKLGLVAAVLAFAALNRFRHVAGAGSALRRSATAEAGVGAGVLLLSAVLAGFTPSATLAAAKPRPTQLVATGSDFATTTRVRLTASPGTAGPNHFVATVRDYDTGKPIAATAVTLRFALDGRSDIAASTVALRHVGATWVADSPVLAVDGRWRVTTVVQTAAGGTEVPVVLRTRAPPTRITAQRTPGLPTIYTITTGSRQVQGYVDPGKVGANEVHFTFLDVAGQPIDVELVAMTGQGPDKVVRPLEFRRLDTGHFVGDGKLDSGRWRFGATTADGFSTAFTETIGL